MPPEAPVTLLSVWTLGIALGLTACTVTCLPFIGTWALGRAEAGRGALVDTGAFLAGRLFSYTCLGALAGGLGAWFVKEMASGVGNLAIGASSLVAAAWLAWPQTKAHTPCLSRTGASGASPFLMGVSLTLIPCAPLATLLATCAAGETALAGAKYGMVFGLGAVITPMIVLIPSAARLGRILRDQGPWLLPWIRYGAALVLLMLGAKRIALVDESFALAAIGIFLLVLAWRHHRLGRGDAGRRVIPIVFQP